MYAQVEKSKENKSRAVANSIAREKSTVKQGVGFVDNRAEAVAQRKLQGIVHDYSISQPIQEKGNKTGLPDNLKTGIENLSALDDPGGGASSSGNLQAQSTSGRLIQCKVQWPSVENHL